MARIRTYRCPSCEGQFDFMHHPTSEPPPRFCPLCGYDTEGDAPLASGITAPHIQKSISRAGDATYRQMEGQAEERMDMAAQMTGLDRSEFSDLKITDIKDNLREGDTADVSVVNDVSKAVDADPNNYGFRPQLAPMGAGGPSGMIPDARGNTPLGYASMTTQGPAPYAGAKAATMVGNFHRQNARAIVAAGTEKTYSGKSG